MMTDWTSGGDWFVVTTGVANQLIGVIMKGEWKKTVRAEDLVTTVFTEREWGRAATIMKK